jgi:hypothetical protein
MTRFFYYSVAKLPGDMTPDELEQEITAALQYEDRCREIGQGVNTKESLRKRSCELELVKHPNGIDRWTALVVNV